MQFRFNLNMQFRFNFEFIRNYGKKWAVQGATQWLSHDTGHHHLLSLDHHHHYRLLREGCRKKRKKYGHLPNPPRTLFFTRENELTPI